MRVRILTDLSDETRGYVAGELTELPDDKAERWIRAGIAASAEIAPAALEAAALDDARVERAAHPSAKKRG